MRNVVTSPRVWDEVRKIVAPREPKHPRNDNCQRGIHDYQEFIDPQSGGFIQCKDCGKQVDCENPDGDVQ